MKSLSLRALALILLCAGPVGAVSITVDPSTGTGGSDPTDTILDAIAQVSAGGDAINTITLADAVHPTGDDVIWDFVAGKTYNFVAASGRPIIRVDNSAVRFVVTIRVPATAEFSFTGIDFIPRSGNTYANNGNDAFITWADATADFNIPSGTMTFTDCIFGANDGSDGVAPLGAHSTYAGNTTGDDWWQFGGGGIVTFDNCLLTGSGDDALLMDGDGFTAGSPAQLNLINGTCIAEIGGAGIQLFGGNVAVNLDGSAARVSIINTGQRSGATDVLWKNFATNGLSLDISDADLIGCTNGGIFDFGYMQTVNITRSRIAFANASDVGTAANIAIASSGVGVTAFTLDNVTVHDAISTTVPDGIAIGDGGPDATWTITNSIFSGAADTFDLLRAGGTGTVTISNSAVVTAGPHAVAAEGDLGTGQLAADPGYASLTYASGRGEVNELFLQPSNTPFDTSSDSGGLIGGSPTFFTAPPAAEGWQSFE